MYMSLTLYIHVNAHVNSAHVHVYNTKFYYKSPKWHYVLPPTNLICTLYLLSCEVTVTAMNTILYRIICCPLLGVWYPYDGD